MRTRKPTSSAVIYARVSSREQSEGYSIDAQLKLLREYAQRKGLPVRKEFIDVETAKAAGRKQFTAMLDFVRQDPHGIAILAEKTDRMYRNFTDLIMIEELSCEVHLAKEGKVVSSDSSSHDKTAHGIMVVLSKSYVDNLSEEVKKGMYEKADQGGYPGKAPIGYVNNPLTRKVDVDPATAPSCGRYLNGTRRGTTP
jgi:DNA invertase Pin-like site-specific DNA recombinase